MLLDPEFAPGQCENVPFDFPLRTPGLDEVLRFDALEEGQRTALRVDQLFSPECLFETRVRHRVAIDSVLTERIIEPITPPSIIYDHI